MRARFSGLQWRQSNPADEGREDSFCLPRCRRETDEEVLPSEDRGESRALDFPAASEEAEERGANIPKCLHHFLMVGLLVEIAHCF